MPEEQPTRCAAEKAARSREVQVESENHRMRRAVQVGFVSNKANVHVGLGFGHGSAGPDLD